MIDHPPVKTVFYGIAPLRSIAVRKRMFLTARFLMQWHPKVQRFTSPYCVRLPNDGGVLGAIDPGWF